MATTRELRQLRLSVVRQIKRLATLGRSDELGAPLGFRTENRAVLGQRSRLSELPTKGALYFTDVLFAALAANRAKWSFRTSSPEVLAAVSDK
jgi:hypothetical protein